MTSRRAFIKKSAFATVGGMMIPNFLKAFEMQHLGQSQTTDKILVVIQLSGGNDGLNTIVPYRNDIYYKSRPSIAIQSEKVLKLNDEVGLNSAMESLRALYDNGQMSIINNVGYPNPDRSHFRSMDIWQTASESTEYLNTGWIGRYLDANCAGNCVPYQALEIDDTLSLSMKGEKVKALSVQDPEKLYKQVSGNFINKVAQNSAAQGHDNVAYLYKTLAETASSAEFLHTKSKIYRSSSIYPQGELGQRLKTISELIISGMSTNIYYVSISGFDTHFNQVNQQERLLKNYAESVNAFVNDLKKNDKFKEVAIMTFSEFGRRVKQNASGGTDHGTANNVFLMSENLKRPKVLNEAPNLTDLDEGDLKFSVDFRQIYASLLKDWLKTESKAILGKNFESLKIL
ncbi:hypothetical protein GCM10011514_30530 [Emticicia aquatilis]|uniref:DUF1501 domain-containing protein n=1 Tax=Emticicia aquatilis TaxID=1537369 RepID=A0A916YWJ2_9BACT|nr:DUF1501 domain-containing protein [Emticicia aquatilis]GGD64441.1 hypothetical protein GCM10011514_30530 [Emticicia aquatilis]